MEPGNRKTVRGASQKIVYPTWSFIFWLRRPYFDLGPAPDDGPVVSFAPLLAYRNLDNHSWLALERVPGENFRFNLLAESGLAHFAAFSPQELDLPHRTARWQHLCDLVESYKELPPSRKLSTLSLLTDLGFHRLVLQLVPRDAGCRISDELSAAIAALRALVCYSAYQDDVSRYQRNDFEEVVRVAPENSIARYSAALILTVYFAKFKRDLAAATHYRLIAERGLRDWPFGPGDFEHKIRWSRFYRGASLVPYLEGDKDQAHEELNAAEHLAWAAKPRTPDEALVARDNLCSVLETRMREALSWREADKAEAYMRKSIDIDPWDPKLHMELGEVLLLQGHLEEAAQEYERAACYSPPGTALALYSAGYCYEKLDDPWRAHEAYLGALRADSDGVSPLLGLLRTSRRVGNRPLYLWSLERAQRLRDKGELIVEELATVTEAYLNLPETAAQSFVAADRTSLPVTHFP